MKHFHLFILLVLHVTCFSQNSDSDLGKLLKSSLDSRKGQHLGTYVSLNNGGEIWTPIGFSRNGRGTDSEMGTLSNNSTTINFDIGSLAGVHIGVHNKNNFNLYYDTIINGNKTSIGIKKHEGVAEVIVTTHAGHFFQNNPFLYPANFRAVIKNEEEIKRVLKIATSYTPIKKIRF